jgi:hypothetical protein
MTISRLFILYLHFLKKYKLGTIIGIFIGIFSVVFVMGWISCEQIYDFDKIPQYCIIYNNDFIGIILLPLEIIGIFIVPFSYGFLGKNVNFLSPISLIFTILTGAILLGTVSALIEKTIYQIKKLKDVYLTRSSRW